MFSVFSDTLLVRGALVDRRRAETVFRLWSLDFLKNGSRHASSLDEELYGETSEVKEFLHRGGDTAADGVTVMVRLDGKLAGSRDVDKFSVPLVAGGMRASGVR